MFHYIFYSQVCFYCIKTKVIWQILFIERWSENIHKYLCFQSLPNGQDKSFALEHIFLLTSQVKFLIELFFPLNFVQMETLQMQCFDSTLTYPTVECYML